METKSNKTNSIGSSKSPAGSIGALSGASIKLGIFVTLAIVLFIVSLYFIGKKQQLFETTFHAKAIFKDINGLMVGNNIRFSGINVGIVESIEQINDSSVMVDLVIGENSRKFIKKNATAIIGSDGLMGNKIVQILPGIKGQQPIVENDYITTARAVSMDDIMMKLKVTSDNSAEITGDLSAIMHSIRNGKGTIGKLFMDTVFADNLDKTLVSVKQGAGGFKRNMDAASKNILLRNFFKKKKKE